LALAGIFMVLIENHCTTTNQFTVEGDGL